MTEKRSGKRRKILRVLIGILLVMAAVVCCLHFGEKQIQRMMKKIICAKVIKYEDELLEIAKECPLEEAIYYYEEDEDDSNEYFKTIYYKDLDDENVDRMFRTFRLIMVTTNSVYGDGCVEFYINPTVISALWDDYMYGFYYTENDEPVDVVWGTEVEETEFEYTIEGWGRYWYRTEKITDNWWYYETKWLWSYPVKR